MRIAVMLKNGEYIVDIYTVHVHTVEEAERFDADINELLAKPEHGNGKYTAQIEYIRTGNLSYPETILTDFFRNDEDADA
jgi:hypothetical protein